MRKKILALVITMVMIFANVGIVGGCSDDAVFTAPTITLAYDNVVIGKGATYDLLDGVTVSDEYDTNIAAKVENDGGFDKDVVGKYTVTYSATNSKNKESTAKRTVEVAEGILPDMGSYVKKGSALAVPSFSGSASDAALTVSYKASGESDWTKIEKTEGAYILNIGAGDCSVKYEAKKDKFEYTETVSLKIYEITAPGNSVTIVGQNVTVGTPSFSDNIDGEFKVYAKTGDAAYTEIELDEASQSYKIKNIAEGVTDVKYVVTVAEGVTEEMFCTITAVNAQLADTSLDRVAEAGQVTLRTPVVSTGVDVKVAAELRDSTRAAVTVTDNKINVALGDVVKVTYAYKYGELDLGSDSYYVYCARTGANVIDFESGSFISYTGANQDVLVDNFALSGNKSMKCCWTSGAMGNWLGFKQASFTFESAVNTIDVYLYLGANSDGGEKDAFVNPVELAIETDKGWIYPVDSETNVHWQTITKGWAKYTFAYDKSFTTLKAATLHLNGNNANDAGYQVYMDDIVCYAR